MRTDVKVGLVCVLILVIAVVSYFAMQGKSKEPLQTQTNRSTNTSPATPADSTPASGSVAVSPPATVSPATPAATTMAAPPVGYSIVPTVGQTPSIYSPPSSPTGSSTTAPAGGSALYPPGGSRSTLLPPVGGTTTAPALTGGLPPEPTPSLPGAGTTLRPVQVDPGMRPGDSLLEPGTTRTPPSGTRTPGAYTPPGSSTVRTPGLTTTYTPGLTGGTTTAAGTYAVQNGDNLTSIAKKNHTTVSALKAANPTINPDRLKIKQVINLPAPTVVSGTSMVTGLTTTRPSRSSTRPATTGSRTATGARSAITPGSSYKVKKGDTLRKIAKAAYGDEKLWRRLFRVNRGELASANDLEPGMVLKIPAR